MADALGVGVGYGVVVNEIHLDSPAERAGLQVGDVIVSIDGARIANEEDFQARLFAAGSDDPVRIEIWRGNRKKSVRATLESSETIAGFISTRNELLGWELQELSRELAREFGYRPGTALIITDITSGKAAARSGLRRGDVLLEVNRQRVGTFKELREKLEGVDVGESTVLLIQRGRRTFYIAIRMPGA